MTFNIKYDGKFSRGELLLRTLFGGLYIGVPHGIILAALGLVSGLLRFITFWIILFTGQYPRELFNFQVGFLAWATRVRACTWNLVDGYPAFGLKHESRHVEFNMPYPEKISRGTVFLRTLLGLFYVDIPHGFVLICRAIVGSFLMFLAFWSVLFTGKMPEPWFRWNEETLRWAIRVSAYKLYLTDDYPPFGDMDSVRRGAGGYAIPIMLTFIGEGLMIYFLATIYPVPQPMGVFWGAICLLIAGAFAMPVVHEGIGKKAKTYLTITFAAISALLFYAIYASIGGEIDYLEQKDARTKKIVQDLTDIRSAQQAYCDVNGQFTNNFDTLIQFVVEPKMSQIKKLGGELNDSIGGGRYEAYVEAGYILSLDDIDSIAQIMQLDPDEFLIMIENDKSHYKVRDTTLVSFYDLKFSPQYRMEKELPQVNLDSLPYDPFSGEKFIIRVSSTEVARVKTSTIEVLEPQPFRRPGVPVKLDTLRFGSLTDAHTDGNWKKFE